MYPFFTYYNLLRSKIHTMCNMCRNILQSKFDFKYEIIFFIFMKPIRSRETSTQTLISKKLKLEEEFTNKTGQISLKRHHSDFN